MCLFHWLAVVLDSVFLSIKVLLLLNHDYFANFIKEIIRLSEGPIPRPDQITKNEPPIKKKAHKIQ